MECFDWFRELMFDCDEMMVWEKTSLPMVEDELPIEEKELIYSMNESKRKCYLAFDFILRKFSENCFLLR